MARRQNTTQGPGAIGPALVGIALVSFSADFLEKASGMLCHVFCTLVGVVLQGLPGILFAALQGLESYALDHAWTLAGVQVLTWAGSLVHCLLAA